MLKRREESDTYLTHACRHRWSRKSMVKIDEMSFQSTLWLSSAINVASAISTDMSGRCCFLPLFLTFCTTTVSNVTISLV